MGSGLVSNSKQILVPGIDCSSWHDDPALRLTREDRRKRGTAWVRSIVLHTTRGIPGGRDKRDQVIRPGFGPGTQAGRRLGKMWSSDGRYAGAHLTVGHDGRVSCHADLATEAAFHAGPCNEWSIGIEIEQGRDAELYEGQLQVTVSLVDWLTATFGIQRQIPGRYLGPVPRLESGGADVVGVYGHRDCSSNRGPGDPGNAIFNRLGLAGYETFDFELSDDREAWRRRQRQLGLDPDGVPGPGTVSALQAAGHAHGMFVSRHVDAFIPARLVTDVA